MLFEVAINFVGERLVVPAFGKTRATGREGNLDLTVARKTRIVSLYYLFETAVSKAIRLYCR